MSLQKGWYSRSSTSGSVTSNTMKLVLKRPSSKSRSANQKPRINARGVYLIYADKPWQRRDGVVTA